MSRRDDSVSLRQMLDHAREAVVMIRPHTRSDLDTNRMLSLALVQLAQIVGEAANRVSKAERERRAEIPWGQIIGLRNRLVHGYDSINSAIARKEGAPRALQVLQGSTRETCSIAARCQMLPNTKGCI